jgi:pimeloyl-ACP methyl ester carboxylesterase
MRYKALICAAVAVLVMISNAEAQEKTVIFCGVGGLAFCGSMAYVASKTGGELRDFTQETTVEAEILAARPKYVKLGGFSMGGLAAKNLADRLIKKGIRVEKLALLAPFLTDSTSLVKKVWRRQEWTPIDHVGLAFLAPDEMIAFLNSK